MRHGVYAKQDYEAAVSGEFCLVFYRNAGVFGTKLYRREKLIAAVERDSAENVTSYAFINSGGEAVFNSEGLRLALGESLVIDEIGLFRKDDINIIPADTEMPTVSEKGIAHCLKHWKLGNRLIVSEDAIDFTMNTSKIEYVMSIRTENDNIYCGASVNIPYDGGLFGGGQYFRIRNYADNTQPWCYFRSDLGGAVVLPDFDVPEQPSGACITTEHGYYWEVKRHTDDEIVLQGCDGDEYFYHRGVHMTERFSL